MNDRFHVGTFLWGAMLTIGGAALAAVGFGWWDMPGLDLRYVAPTLVILVGIAMLIGSSGPRRARRDIDAGP